MARRLVHYWEPELGTRITVKNIDGNATLDGTEYFLEQPDDGSTIYIGTQLYLSSCIILQDAEFTMEDFAIINIQQFDPVTIAVRADSPYATVQDLIRDIKERPGALKCGYVPGGAPHIASEFLRRRLGIDYEAVTFASGNGTRTALLGRDVDFIFSSATGDHAIEAGVHILAIGDTARSLLWPAAPTFNQFLGVTDSPQLGSARFIAVRSSFREKYPERFERLVETYRNAFDNPEYTAFRQSTGEVNISSYWGPEESTRMNNALHILLELYAP